MNSCEVLIVGGGPAGSACAWFLRQAGLDVLLMDVRSFPRDKPCAGWITPPVLATLAIDRDDYRRGRVLQEIRCFRTSLMGGDEIVTRYDRVVSYGIRRCEFDQYLLERSDARLLSGEPVRIVERAGGRWLVNGHIRARLVVGAGGHYCPVARFLGARIGSEESIIAQSAEFPLDSRQEKECRIPLDMPELLFSRDLKGYGWIFRKGAFLNVGFGRMDSADFKRHMAEFRRHLEQWGVITGAVVRFQGHAYRVWQRQGGRKKIDDGVLLIGDSAGLAHPQSGEGILPAIESALLAAETIVAAGGDYRRDNLESYLERLRRRYDGGVPDILASLPAGLIGPVAARLFANRLFVRHVVLDRWFLHSRQKTLSGEKEDSNHADLRVSM